MQESKLGVPRVEGSSLRTSADPAALLGVLVTFVGDTSCQGGNWQPDFCHNGRHIFLLLSSPWHILEGMAVYQTFVPIGNNIS